MALLVEGEREREMGGSPEDEERREIREKERKRDFFYFLLKIYVRKMYFSLWNSNIVYWKIFSFFRHYTE